jgi:hypothetical protein
MTYNNKTALRMSFESARKVAHTLAKETGQTFTIEETEGNQFTVQVKPGKILPFRRNRELVH